MTETRGCGSQPPKSGFSIRSHSVRYFLFPLQALLAIVFGNVCGASPPSSISNPDEINMISQKLDSGQMDAETYHELLKHITSRYSGAEASFASIRDWMSSILEGGDVNDKIRLLRGLYYSPCQELKRLAMTGLCDSDPFVCLFSVLTICDLPSANKVVLTEKVISLIPTAESAEIFSKEFGGRGVYAFELFKRFVLHRLSPDDDVSLQEFIDAALPVQTALQLGLIYLNSFPPLTSDKELQEKGFYSLTDVARVLTLLSESSSEELYDVLLKTPTGSAVDLEYIKSMRVLTGAIVRGYSSDQWRSRLAHPPGESDARYFVELKDRFDVEGVSEWVFREDYHDF